MSEARKNASNEILLREGLGGENPTHVDRAADMCSFQTDVSKQLSAEAYAGPPLRNVASSSYYSYCLFVESPVQISR